MCTLNTIYIGIPSLFMVPVPQSDCQWRTIPHYQIYIYRPSLTYKALWSAVHNMRMLYFLSMYSKQKWKCNFFIFCKRLDRYGIRVYFIKGIYIDLITGGSMYKHYQQRARVYTCVYIAKLDWIHGSCYLCTYQNIVLLEIFK